MSFWKEADLIRILNKADLDLEKKIGVIIRTEAYNEIKQRQLSQVNIVVNALFDFFEVNPAMLVVKAVVGDLFITLFAAVMNQNAAIGGELTIDEAIDQSGNLFDSAVAFLTDLLNRIFGDEEDPDAPTVEDLQEIISELELINQIYQDGFVWIQQWNTRFKNYCVDKKEEAKELYLKYSEWAGTSQNLYNRLNYRELEGTFRGRHFVYGNNLTRLNAEKAKIDEVFEDVENL